MEELKRETVWRKETSVHLFVLCFIFFPGRSPSEVRGSQEERGVGLGMRRGGGQRSSLCVCVCVCL